MDPKAVALRIVLAHWPDKPYILHGVASTFGDRVDMKDVVVELDRLRTAHANELECLGVAPELR